MRAAPRNGCLQANQPSRATARRKAGNQGLQTDRRHGNALVTDVYGTVTPR